MPLVLRALLALVALLALLAPPARAAGPAGTQLALARAMAQAGGGSGALVVDLDTGRELYALRPDVPRTPASVQKLYTTATALVRFGTEARLQTQALGATPLDEDGVLAGDLWLRGGGDPTFGPAEAARLARHLADEGLVAVRGRVVGDESAFDARRGPPSSGYRTSTWVGPLSALSFNRGRSSHGFQLDPPRYAAQAFRTALRREGVRVRRGRASAGAAPATATPLAETDSPDMAELVRETNLPSDNYAAELLLKALGLRFGDAGTTGTGVGVVAATLRELGIRAWAVDGSGLSHANRTSPRQVVRLLAAMAAAEAGPAFEASLPVAGRSGTLRLRMRRSAARDRCRAKTGTLFAVSALAGYCTSPQGGRTAFALLFNHVNVYRARRAQDTIAGALARYTPAVALAARRP